MRRQDNERAMQGKIDQLERELNRVKSQPLPSQPTRLPTPAERYLVNPRLTVSISDHHRESESTCQRIFAFHLPASTST